MGHYTNWLTNSLRKELRDVHQKTPIVLLPTGQINACATGVPNHPDEAIVLLELRLTLALEYMTDLAFWSILSDGRKETGIHETNASNVAAAEVHTGNVTKMSRKRRKTAAKIRQTTTNEGESRLREFATTC
jgi:hypothetical protein